MKAKKSKGKPAANRAAKDLAPKRSRAVKGGSIKQERGGSVRRLTSGDLQHRECLADQVTRTTRGAP